MQFMALFWSDEAKTCYLALGTVSFLPETLIQILKLGCDLTD